MKPSLSILMVTFSGESGLAGFIGAKDNVKWWWQLELQDVQSSSHPIGIKSGININSTQPRNEDFKTIAKYDTTR